MYGNNAWRMKDDFKKRGNVELIKLIIGGGEFMQGHNAAKVFLVVIHDHGRYDKFSRESKTGRGQSVDAIQSGSLVFNIIFIVMDFYRCRSSVARLNIKPLFVC